MSNTVLFMSDEHNPFYSTPYGHPWVVTPNMQRLADEGTVYENAYCNSPLCMPSRCSFISGLPAHQVPCYSNCTVNLYADLPTYGAVLAQQGVHTAYVGKTHVYADGDKLGFSEAILALPLGNRGDTNHRRTPLAIRPGSAGRAGNYGPRERPFSSDVERMDRAVEWLEEVAPGLDKPWLLAVNLIKPHFPHYVPQELWDMYAGKGDLPEHGPENASASHPYARDLRDHFQTDEFSEEDIRGLRRGYYGCVTFIDRQIGRIMDALADSEALADTNVIYTSDHGDMLGKFGMWWKCSLYEDSARVPLIAAGPDFEAGRRLKTPVELLDLQADLFRIFDAERPDDWRGQALGDIAGDDAEHVVFSEYHGHGSRSGSFMIRKGNWKFIWYAAAPHQLFNLAEDPNELANVFDREPEKAAELEAELRDICSPERENERAHEFERAQFEILDQRLAAS